MLDLIFFHVQDYKEAKRILRKIVKYFEDDKHNDKFLTLYLADRKKSPLNVFLPRFGSGVKDDFYHPVWGSINSKKNCHKYVKNKKDAKVIIRVIPASYKSYLGYLYMNGIDLVNSNYAIITSNKDSDPTEIYWVYRKYECIDADVA